LGGRHRRTITDATCEGDNKDAVDRVTRQALWF
jgi:hypothetical protein